MSVYCGWCGKQRRKLSGFQKRSACTGQMIEICAYCKRFHESQQINNPFGGLLQELVPVGTSSANGEPK